MRSYMKLAVLALAASTVSPVLSAPTPGIHENDLGCFRIPYEDRTRVPFRFKLPWVSSRKPDSSTPPLPPNPYHRTLPQTFPQKKLPPPPPPPPYPPPPYTRKAAP